MSTVTENDLKKIEEKIDKLTEMVISLTIGQAEIKTELREKLNSVNTRLDNQDKRIQKIPDLAEKVGELKNWRSIALVIISGTVTTLMVRPFFLRLRKLVMN